MLVLMLLLMFLSWVGIDVADDAVELGWYRCWCWC